MSTGVQLRSVTLPRGHGSGAAPDCRYPVFLSYSHADMTWANWVMRRLEGYRVPSRFHGRRAPIGVVGPRIVPVFRDRDELPTASDLGETIRSALRDSATLVVICSRRSARSRWVSNEILEFKRLHGEAGVFAFIVDGDPVARGTEADCFSPALRHVLGLDGQASGAPVEVVAADARPQGDGREDAFLRLVAGLLGVGFDELRRRELQRRHRRMTLIATGSVLGMAVTFGLAVLAWQARQDARRRQQQAEDLLGFMLGDLRTRLERVGRLDVLEAVADKAFGYFAGLDSRDLTDATLLNLAKANTQIGDVRVKQVQYPEAARAFLSAYERAKALAARHPQDGSILFERAQAEYWIGHLCFLRGDWGAAEEWWTRYRDSTLALVKLDPGNTKWQREAQMGNMNLYAVELERGNHAAARRGFLEELAVRERMAAERPGDADLQASVANIVSFLGTVAERSGDFAGAIERFGQQIRLFEELMRKDPGTVRWKDRLANCLALQAGVLAVSGQREAARERRARARELLASPTVKDASNRALTRQALKVQVDDAMVVLAGGDAAGARRMIEDAVVRLEQLAGIEPTDRRISGQLATALRMQAGLVRRDDRARAAATIRRALAIGEKVLVSERANEVYLGEYANACVQAGLIAEQDGDPAAARRHWELALETVRSRRENTSHWRLLDPAARALGLLGRTEESRTIILRLELLGYQPLEPWPAPR